VSDVSATTALYTKTLGLKTEGDWLAVPAT